MTEIKILLIDSSQNFSKAASSFLLNNKAVEVVEVAKDLEQALAIVEIFNPDYLIIEEALIIKEQVNSKLLSLLNEKLSGVKIITMVLYEDGSNFTLNMDRPTVVARVSKQNFYAELSRLFSS